MNDKYTATTKIKVFTEKPVSIPQVPPLSDMTWKGPLQHVTYLFVILTAVIQEYHIRTRGVFHVSAVLPQLLRHRHRSLLLHFLNTSIR